jgi:DNA-binding transcriptional LysR family regulator
MGLDPEDLNTFLTVVREKSFGRAAVSLMVSQPTVSERVARIERATGVALFVRGPRGVALTPSGELMEPYAERILGLMDEAVDAAGSVHRLTPLKVGVHSTFGYRVVPLVVEALELPSRGVRFRDAHSDQIIAMLHDGLLDIGFVVPGARPPGVRFDPLPPDPVICVCAPDHQLAQIGSVSLRAVSECDVAVNLWGTGAHEFNEQLAPRVGGGRRVECSDAGSAIALARHQGYVAFVARSAAEGQIAAGTLTTPKVRGVPSWNVRLVMASRTGDDKDSDVTSLRLMLRQPAPTTR